MKNTEYRWGCCPDCKPAELPEDGTPWPYVNIGSEHWFYCDEHQTRWCAGDNLFSSWREDDQERWYENMRRIGGYRDVGSIPRKLSQANVLIGRNNPRVSAIVGMFDELQTFQDAIDAAQRVLAGQSAGQDDS